MSKSGGFNLKRTVCAAATATLAASGLFVSAAQAADSDLFYGDIDPSKPRTVRIHKFESGSLQGDVTERKDDGRGDGVIGVPFKLHPINVDLTTAAGWDTISKITNVPADACAVDGGANWAAFPQPNTLSGKPGAQVVSVTTEAGGVATASNIDLGAYLVCEQSTNDATNAAGEKVSVVRKSAPFIVTVPRPQRNGNGDNTGWIYDINAYPKNTVVESPKKATQILKTGAKTDKGVQYTITSKVPNLLATENFKHFSVIDQMPEQLAAASVLSVTVEGEPGAVGTENYKVDYREAQDFLAVNFTSAGLAFLKTKPNKKVVVTIQAKIDSLTNKGIENTGYLVVDKVTGTVPGTDPTTPVNPGGPGKPPTYPNPSPELPDIKASNKSASTWGDIKIKKHDVAQETAGLEGAQFQVFEAADQQACVTAAKGGVGKFTKETVTGATTGNAITVGADSTFTTPKGGELVIEGLYIHHIDGATPDAVVTPQTTRCYVLKETRAPAGYVLPAEEDRTFAVMVKAGTSTDADLTMPNTKVSVPALPLTGASGRVLLMVGGLALVLGSMGVVMVVRKRNAEA